MDNSNATDIITRESIRKDMGKVYWLLDKYTRVLTCGDSSEKQKLSNNLDLSDEFRELIADINYQVSELNDASLEIVSEAYEASIED